MNIYRNLQAVVSSEPFFEQSPGPPHMVFPVLLANLLDGTGIGAESALTWAAAPTWRILASHSWLELKLRSTAAPDARSMAPAGEAPRSQAQLRSSWDLSKSVQFDAGVRFVGRLQAQALPSYTLIDARLAWRPGGHIEIAASADNLLNRRHYEFVPALDNNGYRSAEFGRSASVQATWWF